MRVLLVGGYRENVGPANVNKKIIKYMPGDFSYIKCRKGKGPGKILMILELLIKLCFSQVTIVSTISRNGYIAGKFCACFHKKLVFLMHGCVDYEIELNKIEGQENSRKWEKYLMEHATLILPVSYRYGAWLRERYPNMKHRIGEWLLGSDSEERVNDEPRNKGLILTAGGNMPQKNNNKVSDAVAGLNGAARLEIYGHVVPDWPSRMNENTKWMGQVPNSTFIKRLSVADVFIVNSTLESFNISLMEALRCGCNILVSANVGALDLLEVEPADVINDVNDVNELRSKILHLLDHPNHDRICAKIAWNEITNARAVSRLREICENHYRCD